MLNNRPTRHPGNRPSRRAHPSCRVEGAIWPPAHVGDPAQVGVVGGDKGLQLLVCEAACLWQSFENRWDDVDAVQRT
eukprot:364943-Chlamydomonas_euryale.AAC.20